EGEVGQALGRASTDTRIRSAINLRSPSTARSGFARIGHDAAADAVVGHIQSDKRRQRGCEGLWLHWLGQVAIHASVQATLLYAPQRVGGQGDDWDPTVASPLHGVGAAGRGCTRTRADLAFSRTNRGRRLESIEGGQL